MSQPPSEIQTEASAGPLYHARRLFQRLVKDKAPNLNTALLSELIAKYAEQQRHRPLDPEPFMALAYAALELDLRPQALTLSYAALRLQPSHARAQALYRALRAGRLPE